MSLTSLRFSLAALLVGSVAFAQTGGHDPGMTVRLDDEGVSQGRVKALDCAGAGITCSRSGITGTLTVAGGGGGGVAFREFSLCAPGNTAAGVCHTFTNKSAAFVEVANNASRDHLDLSGFTDFRLLVQMSVAAVAADIVIECDTDGAFGTPTTLGTLDNPTTTFTVGAWTTIPAGECKTTGGQYLRAGMANGNGTEDPAVRVIRLQVK